MLGAVSSSHLQSALPGYWGPALAGMTYGEAHMRSCRSATCHRRPIIGAGDYHRLRHREDASRREGYTDLRRPPHRRQTCDAESSEIEAGGGRCVARGLDARKEEDVTAFLQEADAHAPLEVCIFNPGANVNFPILETTERVFRKVWEMACYGGFLTGREAARLMLPRGKGTILFTGATASLRGGIGYAAFASAKFGLRAVAQSMARELGPQEHPCRASHHRCRRRHRLRARAHQGARRRCGRSQLSSPTS